MNKSQDENRCLIFNNCVIEHGKIWFWASNFNALFQGSIDGGIAESLWVLKQGKGTAPLYSKIVKCGYKIIGIPMFTDDILIYDISAEKAKLISIPAQNWGNMHTLERGRFWDGVVCGNYIFMIGFWSAKVLKFDVVNESIIDVIDLYEALEIPFDERFLSFKNASVIGDKIWIPSYVTNCVFVLNPKNMQYQKIVVEKSGDGFADIAYDGEDIWLLPRNRGQFVKWNVQENKIGLYDNYPAEFHMQDEANISCIAWCNGKVYVFPYKADKVFSINKTSNNIETQVENAINHYYENLPTHNEVMKYLFAKCIGKQLCSFCPESKRVLFYDTEKGVLSEHKFLVSEEESLYINFLKWNVIAEENGSLDILTKLLNNKMKKDQERSQEVKHKIGKKIFVRIKRD